MRGRWGKKTGVRSLAVFIYTLDFTYVDMEMWGALNRNQLADGIYSMVIKSGKALI